MSGEWIRQPTGTTSVVFVHGILSSGETCWRSKNGTYWPELLKNENDFRSIGIYVFTYKTGFDSGRYSLMDIVDNLKEHFFNLDSVANSQEIIFVCHSMGGIIVRKLIVDRINDFLDRGIKVGLYLVASPSLGAEYANWLEPIARLAGHSQALALRFSQNNDWLNNLNTTFINLKESNRLKIYGKELLEDRFIIKKYFFKFLFRKQVVPPFAGAIWFGEPIKIPNSDHFSIAKPEDNKALQHRLLLIFIQNFIQNKDNTVSKSTKNFQPPENDSSPPALPAAYMERGCYDQAIATVLQENTKRRIRIVFGLSGSGKTTLISKFFFDMSKELGKQAIKWIDCRLTFHKPSKLEIFRLIVFDNVPNKRHPMFEWLPAIGLDTIIIVTTTHEDVATSIQSKTANFNSPNTIVRLDYFNGIEVDTFLERTLPSSKLSYAMDIAKKLGGLPLAIQLLKDVFIDNNDDFLLKKFKNFNGEFFILLRLWLLSYDDKGDLEKVLNTLCSVPVVGMDRDALTYILQSNTFETQIKILRGIGLISEVSFAGLSIQQDNLLIAHEVVRKNFSNDDATISSISRRRYQELLKTRLSNTTNQGRGILTCIDAWLSAWEDVFDLSSGNFDERYEILGKHLHTLTALDSCWEKALECIPDFLNDRFRNPGKENCAIVIGIAHMVYKLPKSRQLAKIMLIGGQNDDLWARGASLSAAAEQFRKVGDREEGKEELKNWIIFSYENFNRNRGNPSSHWSDPLDLDFLVVIAGILNLGNLNDAITIVENKSFKDRFPHTTLTHLALMVRLAKDGIFSSSKSERFLNIIYDWTALVNSSPQRVQETAFRIGNYLKRYHNVDLKILKPPIISHPDRKATFSLDIAQLIFYDHFFNFVRTEEDSPKIHI